MIRHGQALVVLELDGRHNFEFGLEAQRLTGLKMHLRDVGLADYFQVFRLELLLQIPGDQGLQHLLADVAGKLLANNGGGGLTWPEARQLGALLDLGDRPPGLSFHLVDRHGDLQRVLTTFY